MHRPIILLTLALVTGILLGQAFLFFPYSTIAVIVALAAGGCVMPATARLGRRDLLFTAAGAVAGFAILVAVASHIPERHYRAMPIFDNAAHELTGRISSPLDRDPGRTAFELDLDRIDGREASGTVRVTVRDEALPAGYGDRVSLSGRLYPPRGFRNPGGFDYPAYLATETETRYRENGATVYRTDRHGAITVRLSPAGLDVQPWSELLLRQAAPSGQGGWWTVERSNWKRVAIRTAGI